jgi:outer membrane immunogenic protein
MNPMPVVRAPGSLPFIWQGLYAGLNLGGGVSDVGGFIFGGQIGYNWQVNRLVFGIETDLQYSGQDHTSTIAGVPVPVTQDLDWFGTFRGRVGYAVWDRWLPYVTAGIAYGTRAVSAGGFSASDTGVGWAIGVGVEYAINQAWSARLEYLHISLSDFTPVFGGVAVGAGRLDNDIFRGAVNYRFMR